MTATRAAVYSGGALLLLASLSSALGVARQPPVAPDTPKPVETAGTETLVAEIQAQALRLKTRMASAPAPQEPFRNPFAFGSRPSAPRREPRPPVEAAAPEPPLAPPEPAIELIGVTTSDSPKGPVRTAVISALSGELFLVKEGDLIAMRYRVASVGADAVELTDLILTGTTRRLALKN
jgi:hypothetical protein